MVLWKHVVSATCVWSGLSGDKWVPQVRFQARVKGHNLRWLWYLHRIFPHGQGSWLLVCATRQSGSTFSGRVFKEPIAQVWVLLRNPINSGETGVGKLEDEAGHVLYEALEVLSSRFIACMLIAFARIGTSEVHKVFIASSDCFWIFLAELLYPGACRSNLTGILGFQIVYQEHDCVGPEKRVSSPLVST